MPHRSLPAGRSALRVLLSLALPVLPLAACDARAQREPVAASAAADDYRLTAPVLREALPVLYTPGARTECSGNEEKFRDVRAMSAAEMEKLLDQCGPVKRAAAAQGISMRELALVYKAMTMALFRIAEEEGAKVRGGTAAPLPPGALRDNVALVRQHEAELARLSGNSK